MNKYTMRFFLFFLALATINYFGLKRQEGDRKMTEINNKSIRISKLFLKTKLLCFGRYAIEVPKETDLIIGNSIIDVEKYNFENLQLKIKHDIKIILFEDDTAEITHNKEGPIENSWQIRYYDSKFSKRDKFLFFKTFINKGDYTFIIGDVVSEGKTESEISDHQAFSAKNIRSRDLEEIPSDPGLCLEHGFFAERLYKEQEIDNAGLYLPSFPDVTFSISSNKDAYGDYPPAQFETEMREELSLLNRIQGAKDIQGSSYPKRTLLREGKRAVQHWKGEESLIRRTNGVHDFEWALVGKPRNIANPSVLEVKMYTKVAHNMVGAAEAASLTDDEAIALWDKLLSSLKFRVKVPGAPPGSYYIDPDKPAQ